MVPRNNHVQSGTVWPMVLPAFFASRPLFATLMKSQPAPPTHNENITNPNVRERKLSKKSLVQPLICIAVVCSGRRVL